MLHGSCTAQLLLVFYMAPANTSFLYGPKHVTKSPLPACTSLHPPPRTPPTPQATRHVPAPTWPTCPSLRSVASSPLLQHPTTLHAKNGSRLPCWPSPFSCMKQARLQRIPMHQRPPTSLANLHPRSSCTQQTLAHLLHAPNDPRLAPTHL